MDNNNSSNNSNQEELPGNWGQLLRNLRVDYYYVRPVADNPQISVPVPLLSVNNRRRRGNNTRMEAIPADSDDDGSGGVNVLPTSTSVTTTTSAAAAATTTVPEPPSGTSPYPEGGEESMEVMDLQQAEAEEGLRQRRKPTATEQSASTGTESVVKVSTIQVTAKEGEGEGETGGKDTTTNNGDNNNNNNSTRSQENSSHNKKRKAKRRLLGWTVRGGQYEMPSPAQTRVFMTMMIRKMRRRVHGRKMKGSLSRELCFLVSLVLIILVVFLIRYEGEAVSEEAAAQANANLQQEETNPVNIMLIILWLLSAYFILSNSPFSPWMRMLKWMVLYLPLFWFIAEVAWDGTITGLHFLPYFICAEVLVCLIFVGFYWFYPVFLKSKRFKDFVKNNDHADSAAFPHSQSSGRGPMPMEDDYSSRFNHLIAPSAQHKGVAKLWNVNLVSDWTMTYTSVFMNHQTLLKCKTSHCCKYEGDTDSETKLPNGVGRWLDDSWEGEIITGYWKQGEPVAPYSSWSYGTDDAVAAVRVAYFIATDDIFDRNSPVPCNEQSKPTCGVASVECSVSGAFYQHLPEATLIEGPYHHQGILSLHEIDENHESDPDLLMGTDYCLYSNAIQQCIDDLDPIGLPPHEQDNYLLGSMAFSSSRGNLGGENDDSATNDDDIPDFEGLQNIEIRASDTKGIRVVGHMYKPTGKLYDNSNKTNRIMVEVKRYDSDGNLLNAADRDKGTTTLTSSRLTAGLMPLRTISADSRATSLSSSNRGGQGRRPSHQQYLELMKQPTMRFSRNQQPQQHQLQFLPRANSLSAGLGLTGRTSNLFTKLLMVDIEESDSEDDDDDDDDDDEDSDDQDSNKKEGGGETNTKKTDEEKAEGGGEGSSTANLKTPPPTPATSPTSATAQTTTTKAASQAAAAAAAATTTTLQVHNWVPIDDLNKNHHKDALIFIPGYNSTTKDRLENFGQFLAMSKLSSRVYPFVFCWPGGVGPGYFLASKVAGNTRNFDNLYQLIASIQAAGIRTVHIMTHSMGAQCLLGAMQDEYNEKGESQGRSKLSLCFQLDPEFMNDDEGMMKKKGDSSIGGGGGALLDYDEDDEKLICKTITMLNPDFPMEAFIDRGFLSIRRVCRTVTVVGDRNDGALWWSSLLNGIAERNGYEHCAALRPKRPEIPQPKRGYRLQERIGRSIDSLYFPMTKKGKKKKKKKKKTTDSNSGDLDPRLIYKQLTLFFGVGSENADEKDTVNWLDMDVVDMTGLDTNIAGLRHSGFSLNGMLLKDLAELITTGKRAMKRSTLVYRDGNMFSYAHAPSFVSL